MTLELIHTNPADLLLDRNIRHASADATLVASIQQHGIIEPIRAVRDGDTLRVRTGHRRTLAALAAGLDQVPVLVVGHDDDTDTTTVERISEQFAENQHRAGLSNREQIAAVEQLALLGVPAAQIARRTGLSTDHVAAARTLAGTSHTGGPDLDTIDLIRAAQLAEFADHPVIHADLARWIDSTLWDHRLAAARERLTEAHARQACTDAAEQAGLTVLAERPTHDSGIALAWKLEDADLTADTHTGCPGHVVWPVQRWVNTCTIHDDDHDCDNHPDNCNDNSGMAWTLAWGCTTPDIHGITPASASSGISGGRTGESEADAEARSTARREIIANNKAWKPASEVRRTWIAEHIAGRKTPPKGAAAFLAAHLADEPLAPYEAGKARSQAEEWLGKPIADALAAASENRAAVIGLTLALAHAETLLDKHTWRYAGPRQRAYLDALAGWGYTQAEIEQATATHPA